MRPDITDAGSGPLDEATRQDVVRLVAAATAADGVAPLSEQTLLNLGHDGRQGGQGRARHLLAYDDPSAPARRLLGYAQAHDEGAELVVDPAARREGVGSALLAAILLQDKDARVWAHGDGPASSAFARARGLEPVRELYLLERTLGGAGDALPPPGLPDGFVARAFEPGTDEDEWVRVNAAAFAHHPEQGRMTRADLQERMAEPWFDAAGLLLVVEPQTPYTVVAFHWTKVHAGGDVGAEGADPFGEVYVVGVDPSYQGRGLGRPLTLLGLHHLEGLGLTRVVLYVDGDNAAAMTVYRSLGFETAAVDRMYARP